MDQKFISGAIILTIATLISKLLGSLFKIPLQNIAGDEVLGIFTLVYPVYMAVLIISIAGIPLAISKLISEARAKNNQADINSIYQTALILGIAFGIISFSVTMLFSSQIAASLGGSFVEPALKVVAITLLVAPPMAVYRGYLQGFGEMRPTAYSQVLEQFVRVFIIIVVAVVLVKQGKSPETITAGVMIGSSVGAFFALLYLRKKYQRFEFKPIVKERYNKQNFAFWSKRILIISLPICIGTLTMALLNLVDSLTIPTQLAKHGLKDLEVAYYYGIYGRGIAIVQIAVVFASALILPLIPVITESIAKNNRIQARSQIEKALKLTHLTSWPATVGLVALTLPINLGLFLDLEGNTVLAIFSLSTLFTSFAILTTGILQGLNRSLTAAYVVIIAALVKVSLNLLFVGEYGLMGAAYSTLVTYIILCIINIVLIYRTVPFTVFSREIFVFGFASVVIGLTVVVPQLFFSIEEWGRSTALLYTTVAITVAALLYVIIVLAMKGLKKDELASIPIIGPRLSRYYK